MSGTQALLDVMDGRGSIIATPAYEVTMLGTAAVSPSFTLLLSDATVVGPANRVPVDDAGAILALGTVVAQGVVEIGWLETIAANTGAGATLTYTLNSTVSVGTGSGVLAAAGLVDSFLSITTAPASAANIWLNPSGGAAVVGAGIPVFGGGGSVTFGRGGQYPLPAGNLTAISDSGSVSVALSGG